MFRLPPIVLLLTKTQLLNNLAVSLNVLLHEVVEEITAATYHLQKASAGMVVILVYLQVFCEVVDSLGEDCNLHLRRTGVALVLRIFKDNLCFLLFDHVGLHPF